MEQGLSCLFVSNKTSAASLLLQHPNYGLIGWDPEIMGSLCESGIKTLHHKPIAALKLPVYHYVNKRHADKVDALKQAILRLRNLGVPKNLLQMAVHAGDSCDVQVHTIAS